jgi:hypothetical protein
MMCTEQFIVSPFLVIASTANSIVRNSLNQRFSFQTLHFADFMANNTVNQVLYGELYSIMFLSQSFTTNSRVKAYGPF